MNLNWIGVILFGIIAIVSLFLGVVAYANKKRSTENPLDIALTIFLLCAIIAFIFYDNIVIDNREIESKSRVEQTIHE